MKIIHVFLITINFLILGTLQAGEGTIELSGKGQAASLPEYALINVHVTSICYDTAQEAKNANASLANQLVKTLKEFARGSRDRVTTTGGHFVRQTEYFPSETGGNKILCSKKWRASNTLTLETASISDISKIQDEILSSSDRFMGSDPSKVEQSYAELMQPNFNLYPETYDQLKKKTYSQAYADAKNQLDAIKEGCSFINLQLKSIMPNFMHSSARESARAYSPSEETPVLPDEIVLKASWKFIWTFEQFNQCLR